MCQHRIEIELFGRLCEILLGVIDLVEPGPLGINGVVLPPHFGGEINLGNFRLRLHLKPSLTRPRPPVPRAYARLYP